MSPAPVLRATGAAAAMAAAWGTEGLPVEVVDPGGPFELRPGVLEPLLMTAGDAGPAGSLPGSILPVIVSRSPGCSPALPGLHLGAAGPMDRSLLDELAARPPGRLRPSAPELESACLGLALPMILHNLGNRLVGLVGNLELASMYPPGSEKSGLKLTAARAAAGEVRTYLESLSELRPPGQVPPGARSTPFTAATGLAELLRGRAVTLEAGTQGEAPGDAGHPPGAATAAVAMVVSALLSLRGAGRLTIGRHGSSGVLVSWERPDTDSPGLAGPALVPSLLIGAAAVAYREGFCMAVNALGDLGGSLSCLWPGRVS